MQRIARRTWAGALFLLSGWLALPLSAFAQIGTPREYPVVACPAVPAEFGTAIDQLTALRAEVKQSAHCEPIRMEAGELSNLIDSDRRSRFLEIVRTNRDRSLNPEDSRFLSSYAEEVSNYSLRLVTLLRGRNDCFNADQGGIGISALTTIVHETTSLLSQVAGPYGIPIAIGGNVLTGILRGVQAFEASRSGYRFDEVRDRRAFSEQLCVFQLYRQNLNDLIYPEVRLRAMNRLENHLSGKIREITGSCAACTELMPELLGLINATNPSRTSSPELTEALASRISEIDREFRRPLGAELWQALRTLAWTRTEQRRLQAIAELNSRSLGQSELLRLKGELEYFFFEREAPRFLQWQVQETLRHDHRFLRDLENWVGRAQLEMGLNSREFLREPLSARLATVMSQATTRAHPDLRARIASQIDRSADLLQLAQAGVGNLRDYCRFLREIRAFRSDSAATLCSSQGQSYLISRLQAPESFPALLNAVEKERRRELSGPHLLPEMSMPRPHSADWLGALDYEMARWTEDTSRLEPRR